MPEFVKLEPPPTPCPDYGSGMCCFDLHFDLSSVFPEKVGSPCGDGSGHYFWHMTPDRDIVNCKECLEMIHS